MPKSKPKMIIAGASAYSRTIDFAKIREICGMEGTVRLVITLGYAKEDDKLRPKKRKDMDELVKIVE